MSGRNRFPFTASQWQELEHQALIFKYMASGIPIPPDLLFTIKTSYLDSSLSSKLLIPQHVGWNCFQMGLGKKIDPEPGRCRRTDGKKWRCSKEAFPDSKYCERHMHRGKNRSRKPVEVFKSPTTSASQTPISSSSITHKNNLSNMMTTTSTQTQTPNSNNSLSSLSYDSQNRHNLQYPCYNNSLVYHHHPHHTSSSRPHHGMIGLSSQDSNTSLLFDSDLRRNRYHHVYGMREVDRDDHDHEHEHAFFSEEPSSGTITRGFSSMDDSWQLTPVLSMSCSSSSSSKQRSTCSGLQNEHSYLQLQSASTQAYYKQQEHCDDLIKVERKEEISQKTIHFFDEWPVKEKDSWLDLDDKSSNSGSVSTTQLSISIPNTNSSSYDFPIFGSRIHNGD